MIPFAAAKPASSKKRAILSALDLFQVSASRSQANEFIRYIIGLFPLQFPLPGLVRQVAAVDPKRRQQHERGYGADDDHRLGLIAFKMPSAISSSPVQA